MGILTMAAFLLGLAVGVHLACACGGTKPGFRSSDRQEARGAILPQRRRWVCASVLTSISGAARGYRDLSQRLAKAQHRFENSEPDAFAAPGSRLASGGSGLIAESGLKKGNLAVAVVVASVILGFALVISAAIAPPAVPP